MFAIKYKNTLLWITAIIMLGSLAIIGTLELRLGLDFSGGSLLEVSYSDAPTQTELEDRIADLDWGTASVRSTEASDGRTGVLIRTRDLTADERTTLETTVAELGADMTVERFTSVGPVIGDELKDKAVFAIAGVSIIIILYVAYAFAGIGKPVGSWVYGGITIFVLIHDILVPTALMSVLGYVMGAEIDVLFVMALLAVLGYSVNDTIVIFDRVRENLKANRVETKRTIKEVGKVDREEVSYELTKPFAELVGQAVSQSLARSINTSLTTLIVLTALFILGGSLTQVFALVLFAGVLAGTYSSLCIATPLLVTYAEYLERKAAITSEAVTNQSSSTL